MQTNQRKLWLRVRMTDDEYARLNDLARAENGNLSAFVRKQVFGREADALCYLGRIHGSMLEIARALKQTSPALSQTEAMAHLVATERHVQELVQRFSKGL